MDQKRKKEKKTNKEKRRGASGLVEGNAYLPGDKSKYITVSLMLLCHINNYPRSHVNDL